jgi:cadmium resistance transport/sequestration family protein
MNELFKAIPTGLTAFTATNLDDIVILLLLFSQVNAFFRQRHIVAGQYLGFGALVLASLPGFFGHLFFPRPWIGMLGIVPISIGISRLLNQEEAEPVIEPGPITADEPWFSSILSSQSYSVAAITFANSGDNIGIYVPLFANSTWQELLAILGIFFFLVGVWCYTAYRLTRLPVVATTLTRYGNQLVPFVLIGLGILILIDSHLLENRGLTTLILAISVLVMLMLLRNSGHTSEIKPSEIKPNVEEKIL